MEDAPIIKVYVANLGKYNEGELVGAWIGLPVSNDELQRFLSKEVGLETDPVKAHHASMMGERVYEEYAIHDYNFDGALASLGFRPGEYENLEHLNLLAKCVQAEEPDMQAVRLFMEQQADPNALEYANAVMQADEIPYYPYDLPGSMTRNLCRSAEEALGYMLIYRDPEKARLIDEHVSGTSGLTIDNYFNFESYGADMAHDCILDEGGYLDLRLEGPDLDWYDADDLRGEMDERWAPAKAAGMPTKLDGALERAREALRSSQASGTVAIPYRMDERNLR